MGMLKCEKILDSEGMISLYMLRKRLVKLKLFIHGIDHSLGEILSFQSIMPCSRLYCRVKLSHLVESTS